MKKNNTSLYLIAILTVALLIGLGYAALAATLTINGQTTIRKASWDVHFENINVSTEPGAKEIVFSGNGISNNNIITGPSALKVTTLNYGTYVLQNPGDYTEFTVDVVNGGTIDAKLSSVTLPTSKFRAINAKCVWQNNNSTITTGETLAAGASKTIKCRTEFLRDITTSDLSSIQSAESDSGVVVEQHNLALNYVQAD